MLSTKNIKNLAKVAGQSAWGVKLYYDLKENAVYTEAGAGRWYVAEFIRKNTPEEITQAVNRMLSM